MRTVVGVLRGGPSSEYEVSLKSGASVLEALDREKYEPRDIFISRSGEWHLHGVPVAPEKALQGVDVAFNVIHGEYGEDGQVQRLLEQLGVPYSGSSAIASARAFNRHLTKQEAKNLGVKVTHSMVIEDTGDRETLAHEIFRSFPHPAIIKPVAGASSAGVAVANNFHQLQLALDEAFRVSSQALIEEHIRGREAAVGVINNFRNEATYALLPIPYETLSQKEKNELVSVAKKIHDGLGLNDYSVSNFVVSRRGIYFVEVNTVLAFTKESLLPKALQAVGASLSHFVDHVIQLARWR